MRLSDWGEDRWKAAVYLDGAPLDTQSIHAPVVWDASDEGWIKVFRRDRQGRIDLLKFKEADLITLTGRVEIRLKERYTLPEHIGRRQERRPITRAASQPPSLFEEDG